MLNYKFTDQDIDKYYQLSNKSSFFSSCKTIKDYIRNYNSNNFKSTIVPLGKVLTLNNLNLYEIAMDYLNNSVNLKDCYGLLDIIVTGLKLGKINSISKNNVSTLEKVVQLEFNCETKYVLNNKLSILKVLVDNDKKYINLLFPFLNEFNQKFAFDADTQKKIKSYIESMPHVVEQHPQLTTLYAQLNQEAEFTTNHYQVFNIHIKSNVIANKNNLTTTIVQKHLKNNIAHLIELLNEQELNYDGDHIDYVESKIIAELTTEVVAHIIVANNQSYKRLEDCCSFLIPELIDAIVNDRPYIDKTSVKKYVDNYLLYEKLEKQLPTIDFATPRKRKI